MNRTEMVRSFYTHNPSSPAFDALLVVVCPSNSRFDSRGKYAAELDVASGYNHTPSVSSIV